MAAVRSALCSLRAGFLVRPTAGGITVPVRNMQYNPSFVEPIGTEREEVKEALNSPEGNPRIEYNRG